MLPLDTLRQACTGQSLIGVFNFFANLALASRALWSHGAKKHHHHDNL
jgi:hypothetical protein